MAELDCLRFLLEVDGPGDMPDAAMKLKLSGEMDE
jgi:hypothetical protein